MIDFLRGKLALVDADSIVVDVGGVGYRVHCPNPYAFGQEPDRPVTVYTHYHVREDAVQLYGFATRTEQELFRRLLDVTGVGPRVALGILAGGPPERIAGAIQNEDVQFLTRLPGVGKKTAQRLILDLRDKLDDLAAPYAMSASGGVSAEAAANGKARTDGGAADKGLSAAWREAKDALMALGYTDAETERVRRDVLAKAGEGDGAEQLIKIALKLLYIS